MAGMAGSEVKAEIQAIVVVSQVVPKPIEDVWQVLMTEEGAEALLGKGGRLGDKGHPWRAEDGTNGVTRSFHPLEQIRFTWRRDDHDPARSSMVKLELSRAAKKGTLLEITHDNLPAEADHDFLVNHWQQALARISEKAMNK